ncbi:cobalamin binding intrinsic factor-like [Saccoglossus kowalevskii]
MVQRTLICFVVALVSVRFAETTDKVCGPDTSNGLQDSANQAKEAAFDWLESQHNDQWGWDHQVTPAAVLTLQLTDPTWFNEEHLESQLSVKQLEIEMLSLLSMTRPPFRAESDSDEDDNGNEFRNLAAGRLANYILGLNTTCHKVSDFFGYNLPSILTFKMRRFPTQDFSNYFQYSFAILALCNSNSRIMRTFVDVITEDIDFGSHLLIKPCIYFADIAAMVVTALSCLRDMPEFANHTDINEALQRGISYINEHQESDGSFGNIHASSLAYQAYMAAGVPPSEWQCTDLVSTLIDEQNQDGSFKGQLMATIQVLPTLAGKHYSHINTEMCPTEEEEEEDIPELFDHNEGGDLISMSISVINVLDDNEELGSFSFYVASGYNLYSIMQGLVLFTQGSFNFVPKDTTWGHFIESMYGIKGDNVAKTFWHISNHDESLSVGKS